MDNEDSLPHPHPQYPRSGRHRAETRTFVIPQPFPLWFHIPGVTSHPITGHTLVWRQTPRFLFSNPSHGESQPENTKLHAISGSARDNDFASGNDNSKDSKLIRPVGQHASFHWALETLDKNIILSLLLILCIGFIILYAEHHYTACLTGDKDPPGIFQGAWKYPGSWNFPGGLEISRTWKFPGLLENSRGC